MAPRKQPDRQVKKKSIIEMPQNLEITNRKCKLEDPRVEIKFKMAPRKQPDRQVKKKRKLEMPENLDMTKGKRKLELEEPSSSDIIGTLVSNYGMTGENLVHKIFSYMDVSSLQGGHMVCTTWNLFLVNDKTLWMDILRQTRPFFEFLSKQILSEEDLTIETEKTIWKRYFDLVEQNEELCFPLCCHKNFQGFKRFRMIHIILQDVIQDCPVYEVFQREFIGERLAREIQLKIEKEKEKQPNAKLPKCSHHFELNFSAWLETFTTLKKCRDEMRYQKENNNDLVQFDKEIKNLYQGVNLICIKGSTWFSTKNRSFLYQNCFGISCHVPGFVVLHPNKKNELSNLPKNEKPCKELFEGLLSKLLRKK
jgi:hypothetical protein